MEIVWQKGQAALRGVYEAMQPTHPLAYNTILTVLTKLKEKGIVSSQAYLYMPLVSEAEVAKRSVTIVMDMIE